MRQDVGPVDGAGGRQRPEQQRGRGHWDSFSLELHCGPAWPNLTSDPIMLLPCDPALPAPLGAWPPHSGQHRALPSLP